MRKCNRQASYSVPVCRKVCREKMLSGTGKNKLNQCLMLFVPVCRESYVRAHACAYMRICAPAPVPRHRHTFRHMS